jgi:hypothetical protein
VRIFLMHIARETAGAARTRSSLRPLIFREGKVFFQNFGRNAPREREVASRPINVIASAAKQSIGPRKERVDCFASLAMTLSFVARMSAATSGAGIGGVPGYRCAHPGYGLFDN